MATNYSEVTMYTFDGKLIAELQTYTRRFWARNDLGGATIWISVNDRNYSDQLLQIGNRVVIEHDRLPIWAGELVAPQTNYAGVVELNAQSGEGALKNAILQNRRDYKSTPASVIRALIQDVNEQGDLFIREGTLDDMPFNVRAHGNLNTAYDVLQKLIKDKGGNWWVEPKIDANGRLIFQVNYSDVRGIRYNDYPVLMEGQNIEEGSRPLMVTQSNPINSVIAVSRSIGNKASIVGRADDTASIAKIGLRQTLIDSEAEDISGVNADAARHLLINKNGTRLFNVTAANQGDLFSFMKLGNIMPLEVSSVGFSDGQRGLSTFVKINGIAYYDLENTAPLTLEEVID